MNVNAKKKVPLINLKQIHRWDQIYHIQQTSKLQDPKKANHYTNLKEITLHFKLAQSNKDGDDSQFIYCQLKLSNEAIKILIDTKGAIPITFM